MGSCWKARGMMRGSFLLLLQATIIYCANIQHPVVSAPKCINGRPRCGEDPVSFGNKTRTLTSLSGIFDLPPSDDEAQPFKWPLLTQARLMECLDKEGNHNDILATYSTLQTVDPLRRAYFRDMSSNLVIEKALKTASDFSCLDLTNVGLDVTKEQAKRYNQ